MKETADIMAMLQKMDIHKIVDGLGGGYGNYGRYTMPDETIADLVSRVVKAHEDAEPPVLTLTITNTHRLMGVLGCWSGTEWGVKLVREDADRYVIVVIADNLPTRLEFDLYRKPNQFDNYNLQYGDRVLASFSYGDMGTPKKLYKALCDVLEYTNPKYLTT